MTNGQLNHLNIESKMKLRKLELEAYSTLVNAFRAQGNFSKEKKKILNELRCFLSISIERHQAEIRRAINDENLSKISTNLNGNDLLDTWRIEGRRLIPLLKRMPPKTGVSNAADLIAKFKIKEIESEKLDKINDNLNKVEPTEFVEDNQAKSIVNKVNIQTQTRKRLSSFESNNSKRKCQAIDKSKQQKNLLVSSSSNQPIKSQNSNVKIIENKNSNDKQQPKLLIMSTNSMLNSATNKTQIINSIHPNSLQNTITSDQLIKFEDFNRKQAVTVQTQSPIKSTLSLKSDMPVSLVSTSSTKVYNPKVQNTSSSSPKLMILPNNNQTKTLTIPISHNVKTLQIPSQNPTILYSTQQSLINSTATNLNCSGNALKTVPGNITIQAIKTTQAGSKSNNFIIMPNKTNNCGSTNTQISQAQIANAKGLLRQMNGKEFPIKFISTTDGLIKKDLNNKTIHLNETISTNERQPTIILTNISKETRNLINKNQGNIIKVIPKCATQIQANKFCNTKQTVNPINLPAAGNSATFIEMLKAEPVNRILTAQLTSKANDNNQAVKTTINLAQNPNNLTKSLKVSTKSSTDEQINKIIFSNVVTNQCRTFNSFNNSINTLPNNNLKANTIKNSINNSSNALTTNKIKKDPLIKETNIVTRPLVTKTETENAQEDHIKSNEIDVVQKALDEMNKEEIIESIS